MCDLLRDLLLKKCCNDLSGDNDCCAITPMAVGQALRGCKNGLDVIVEAFVEAGSHDVRRAGQVLAVLPKKLALRVASELAQRLDAATARPDYVWVALGGGGAPFIHLIARLNTNIEVTNFARGLVESPNGTTSSQLECLEFLVHLATPDPEDTFESAVPVEASNVMETARKLLSEVVRLCMEQRRSNLLSDLFEACPDNMPKVSVFVFDHLAIPCCPGVISSSLSAAVAVQVDWITADNICDEVLAPLASCVEESAVTSLIHRALHCLQEQSARVDLRNFLAVLKAWASTSDVREDRLQETLDEIVKYSLDNSDHFRPFVFAVLIARHLCHNSRGSGPFKNYGYWFNYTFR